MGQRNILSTIWKGDYINKQVWWTPINVKPPLNSGLLNVATICHVSSFGGLLVSSFDGLEELTLKFEMQQTQSLFSSSNWLTIAIATKAVFLSFLEIHSIEITSVNTYICTSVKDLQNGHVNCLLAL